MAVKLEIAGVSKHYPGHDGISVHALDGVSFGIEDGEFVSLLGPSGCGKSTLLHILAGFEAATAGRVVLDGRPISGPGADRGMVFQDYALFPWKTLIENVTFGLELRGMTRDERERIARDYIALVGLTGFENRFPHQLSGGMRQRCALARSVANSPEVLLMDEPLAAIDALTRNQLQEEILKVCAARDGVPRKTVVYVTHSIDEAVFLSDRIVVMTPRPGRILQVLEVPFGYPRTDATRLDSRFSPLVAEIWQTLKVHMVQAIDSGRN
ncbi:MAG: ABC transporter ATP-binding protein [Alphaproteobacteria bacterium]|nr:ABC transporter ATP-binding protein [Alphaproteobacteria bacterium]